MVRVASPLLIETHLNQAPSFPVYIDDSSLRADRRIVCYSSIGTKTDASGRSYSYHYDAALVSEI